MIRPVVILTVCFWFAPAPARAQTGWIHAGRELAEAALRKLSGAVTGGGAKKAATIASQAARQGDDALAMAARKLGPKVLAITKEAGAHAPQALRLVARHGDDAARLLSSRPRLLLLAASHGDEVMGAALKHPDLAEGLIEAAGLPAVKALAAVGPRGGRQLAMLHEGGALALSGRTGELFEVVARFGDRGCDFLWRNKAALATGVTLAAFLRDPEPFLNGARDLADVAATHTVAPISRAAGAAIRETGGAVATTVKDTFHDAALGPVQAVAWALGGALAAGMFALIVPLLRLIRHAHRPAPPA